jgi:hypothetical protein
MAGKRDFITLVDGAPFGQLRMSATARCTTAFGFDPGVRPTEPMTPGNRDAVFPNSGIWGIIFVVL